MKLIGTHQTTSGAKYIAQLCKHFGHKIETGIVGDTGFCQFEWGRAEMLADSECLTIHFHLADITARDKAMDVIDRHLARFAFREGFENMTWDV